MITLQPVASRHYAVSVVKQATTQCQDPLITAQQLMQTLCSHFATTGAH